jgi:hypothetical protein
VCTLQGLPIASALTGAKADERETPLDLLAAEPELVAARPGQTLIGDKNYFGREVHGDLLGPEVVVLPQVDDLPDDLDTSRVGRFMS